MNITKPKMANILEEGYKGVATLSHFEVDEATAKLSRMRAAFGHPDELVEPGMYAKLSVNNTLMMTDTRNEWHTNLFAVHGAQGNVLIGGLGIGMVLVPILQKAAVRSVLVVEKYQDVIDLVLPSLQARVPEACKLSVVCADILEWKPPKGMLWDAIYFDIWPTVCGDNVKDMTVLKRRFAKRLNRENPRAWMGCWEEGRVRYAASEARRHMRVMLSPLGGELAVK